MSIPVALPDLGSTLAGRPWGYLITVRDDQRGQTLAIPTRFEDGVLIATVGGRTAANAVARPGVTIVFPGATGHDDSLIVDGTAEVTGAELRVTPTWAVLHRPALGDG